MIHQHSEKMFHTNVLRFSRYQGKTYCERKGFNIETITDICELSYICALHSCAPSLPQPAWCELNGVFIVLVAAAGGVVITKVKLLAMSDWCCCHIFNLYIKGCQISCSIRVSSSLPGC